MSEEKRVIVLKGLVGEGGEWDTLSVGGTDLAEQIFDEFKLEGKKVQLQYWISSQPIDSRDQAIEQELRSYYGDVEGEYTHLVGTSWTGMYGLDEDFRVGGHDLLKELRSYLGKYCYLEINVQYSLTPHKGEER